MNKRIWMLPLAGALLAGCGGGARTVTVNAPPKVPASPAARTKAQPVTSVPTPNAVVHLSVFQTPSGNIGCVVLSTLARCDIGRRSWSPPPRAASCPNVVDFGQGLELGPSGAARFVCAGDTTREPGAAKLAYGDATQVGAFECLSEVTGLTCRQRGGGGGGHGFFLSIQSYRVF